MHRRARVARCRAVLLDACQRAGDAGRVHLDADHVEIRLCDRHRQQAVADAEADVEHDGAASAEHVGEVEQRTLLRQA